MAFTDEEAAYLRSQRLARIATVSPDGQPDVPPVGSEYDAMHPYVGGMDPKKTRKFRNLDGSPFSHDRELVIQRTVHAAAGDDGGAAQHVSGRPRGMPSGPTRSAGFPVTTAAG
jgi:hypothetical protein